MATTFRLLLSVLTFLSVSAHATNFPVGTLGPIPFATIVSTGVGGFSDTFDFTIGTRNGFELGAVTLTLPSPLGGGDLFHIAVPSVTVALLDSTGGHLFDAVYNGTFNDYTLSRTLAAGDYSVLVAGQADGQAGGLYAIALAAVSAVPEPRAWWLMLAGIAAVIPVVRRKLAPN